MGSHRDLCATFYTDESALSQRAFADALREHVATATVDEYVDTDAAWTRDADFEKLSVTLGDDGSRVFAAGSTWHTREPDVWERALAAFPGGDGELAVVDTQEAGAMGAGRLYAFDGDAYVEVASTPWEPEGMYGALVLRWFDVEHDLRPGTHRNLTLQPDDSPSGGWDGGADAVRAWREWAADEPDAGEFVDRA